MDAKKQYIKNAELQLFDSMWLALQREDAELVDQFHIARDLACSSWTDLSRPSPCGGTKVLWPSRILPDHTKLLQENFDMLREDISKRRYVLLRIFRQILKKAGRNVKDYGCYKFWEEEEESWSERKFDE